MSPRFLLAIPLLFAAAAAEAGSLVDVQILDRDTDATLPTYAARGQSWIAGSPGHRYAVRLVNRSGARVLAVLSVDGINAISGQTAAAEQSGYVLDPYGSTEITGWRKNMGEIAAFEFTSLSESYAARTGRPDNVGVIGVAVFRERVRPVYKQEKQEEIASADTEGYARAAPAQSAAPASELADTTTTRSGEKPLGVAKGKRQESLGTGHGEREASYASYTNFDRDSTQPYEIVSLRYDSVANLQALGIVPRPRPLRSTDPQPFPASFVADPPTR